ncbi:MAG: hypothetical protein ACPG8W_01490 [Candidatus Promineifilaceae bacterium]
MRHTLALATFLLLPGTYWVQRLTNNWGVLFYLLLGTVGIYGVAYLSRNWLHEALNERIANLIASAGFLLLIASFFVIYPRVNCQVLNCGSDRDDALNLATGHLLAGEYPYYEQTYHGNPITPMPGAVLLALPFRLLGNAAYQTFFWLGALFLLARNLLGSSRQALVLCGLILLSPAVFHEVMTGGDLWTNGVFVLVLGVLAARVISAENASPLLKIVLAILFGLSLSSRVNFALFAPLVLAYIYHRRGFPTAIRVAVLMGVTTLAVTLPFYLYDPENFAPFQRVGELADLNTLFPYLGSIIVPLMMLILTGFLCLPKFQCKLAHLLISAGGVQLLPTVVGSLAFSLYDREIYIQLMSFGPIFIVFGAMGVWLSQRETT